MDKIKIESNLAAWIGCWINNHLLKDTIIQTVISIKKIYRNIINSLKKVSYLNHSKKKFKIWIIIKVIILVTAIAIMQNKITLKIC